MLTSFYYHHFIARIIALTLNKHFAWISKSNGKQVQLDTECMQQTEKLNLTDKYFWCIRLNTEGINTLELDKFV